MATSAGRSGTQSIERAALLLRRLAERGHFGWRPLDLAAQCGLDRGTTHRMLACLVRERLARRRPGDHRYLPGPLLYELSLALPAFAAFQAASSAALARIARRAGGAALLLLRSGAEFVCAARSDANPVKALTIDVGTRRPLATSAGGVAILLALPRDEAREVTARNLKDVARFGEARVRALETMLRRSRREGYGVSRGDVVPGIAAIGVPIRDSGGEPFAAITVVGTTERLSPARAADLVVALGEEAQRLAREAARHFDAEPNAGAQGQRRRAARPSGPGPAAARLTPHAHRSASPPRPTSRSRS